MLTPMKKSRHVTLPPVIVAVLLQRWIAAGDVFLERYTLVVAGLGALMVAAAPTAIGLESKHRQAVAQFALPAFVAACGVVGFGALAAKHVLADVTEVTQFLILMIGSYLGGILLFGLACLIGLGLLWKHS